MKFLLPLLAATGVLLAACGAPQSAFPEEAGCVVPAPLPTSRTSAGQVFSQTYISRVRNSADTLVKLRNDLRNKYGDDTFYRRAEFRPDFAAYADQTVCTAQGMKDLSAPDTRFTEFDAQLDAALTELIEHTRAGREAVRARNVSDYRDWYKGVDAKVEAVKVAANSQQR